MGCSASSSAKDVEVRAKAIAEVSAQYEARLAERDAKLAERDAKVTALEAENEQYKAKVTALEAENAQSKAALEAEKAQSKGWLDSLTAEARAAQPERLLGPDLAAGPLGPREARGQVPARGDEAVGGAGPQGLCAADRGLRRTQPRRTPRDMTPALV